MSDESKNPSADDLTKTKKPGEIQLTEQEMEQVTGGDSTPTASSPKLYEALHNGTHIAKVIIE